MNLAFEGSGRAWRSFEYKDGVRAVLEFRYHGRPPVLPDHPGSTRCDAFLAGTEEGWSLLACFSRSPEIPTLVQHAWIEEQRVHLMETLSSAVRRDRPTASLMHGLKAVAAIAEQLPRRPPRYPWEYSPATPASGAEGLSTGVGASAESGTVVPITRATGDSTPRSGEEEASGELRQSEET